MKVAEFFTCFQRNVPTRRLSNDYTPQKLDCPECGTFDYGNIVENLQGQVYQNNGKVIYYSQQAECVGCLIPCYKTQKYGWIYLDRNRKMYHLTGKQAGMRQRGRTWQDNPGKRVKRWIRRNFSRKTSIVSENSDDARYR